MIIVNSTDIVILLDNNYFDMIYYINSWINSITYDNLIIIFNKSILVSLITINLMIIINYTDIVILLDNNYFDMMYYINSWINSINNDKKSNIS